MLKSFLKPTKSILCPYCLARIYFKDGDRLDRCPTGVGKNGCGSELPPRYVHKYNQLPPFFMQLIGWSQVGKTVYLQVLTALLMRMDTIWKGEFTASAQTEATLRFCRNVRSYISSGEMPPATQLQLQEAYIMQLEKMPRWGSRTLVSRDIAGEHFNELRFPIEQAPNLIHLPTTFMMISIADLRKSNFSMDQLMSSLIHTLMKYDPLYGKTKRNVVIVLTKADLLVNNLPAKLQNYLITDPYTKALVNESSTTEINNKDMAIYMNNLHVVSDEIQEWVRNQDGGRTLIQLAKNEDIGLKFSIISSTGGAVENGKLNTFIAPMRVLDPLFWALEYQSENPNQLARAEIYTTPLGGVIK